MKLLLIVFRDSIEEEIEEQLEDLGVTAYTRLDQVAGVGQTGFTHARFLGAQDNTVILTALTDERARAVVQGLRRYHDHNRVERKTHVPLHVFTVPCEQEI